MTVPLVGAIASVVAAVVIILEWLWTRVLRAHERENQLYERLGGSLISAGDYELQVEQFRVQEESSTSAFVSKLLQRPRGETGIGVVIRHVKTNWVFGSKSLSADDLWTDEELQDLADEFGVSARYDTQPHGGEWDVYVRVYVDTVDVETVYSLTRNLLGLVAGVDVDDRRLEA